MQMAIGDRAVPQTLHLAAALLPDGVAENVRLSVRRLVDSAAVLEGA